MEDKLKEYTNTGMRMIFMKLAHGDSSTGLSLRGPGHLSFVCIVFIRSKYSSPECHDSSSQYVRSILCSLLVQKSLNVFIEFRDMDRAISKPA